MKSDGTYMYFVGTCDNASNKNDARIKASRESIIKAVKFIGLRVRVNVEDTEAIRLTNDQVMSYQRSMENSMEGSGEAKLSLEYEDTYIEEYTDGTIGYWVLAKVTKKQIDSEKQRIMLLSRSQRTTASESLAKGKSLMDEGKISAALDEFMNALSISEQAVENSDIYTEAKSLILTVFGSLSFKLENAPQYAYPEGGSDNVIIGVYSTKTSAKVNGLMVKGLETGDKATLGSKTGYFTDAVGNVTFVTEHISKDVKNVELFISFAVDKFQTISITDKDFYGQLITLQQSLSLKVPLEVKSQLQAIPSAVAILSVIFDSQTDTESSPELLLREQEKYEGLVANKGYNVIAIDIPSDLFEKVKSAKDIKGDLISHIQASYPDIKRLIYGFRTVNVLGETPGLDGGISVQVKIQLSIINIETGSVEKSIEADGRGYGLSVDDAVGMAEPRAFNKLKEKAIEI